MPHDAHPMGVLVSAMSSLSIFHPDANPALRGQDLYNSKQVRDKQIARILGKDDRNARDGLGHAMKLHNVERKAKGLVMTWHGAWEKYINTLDQVGLLDFLSRLSSYVNGSRVYSGSWEKYINTLDQVGLLDFLSRPSSDANSSGGAWEKYIKTLDQVGLLDLLSCPSSDANGSGVYSGNSPG
ncbi:hypothetical protein OIU78_019564 [Salix suchowensis]|nr:hypothetical protein OIU78_019564 [Salix suchowensis]